MLNKSITYKHILQYISIIVVALIPIRALISVKTHNIIIVVATIIMLMVLFVKHKKMQFTRYVIQFSLFILYCITSIFYSHYLLGTAWTLMRLIPTFLTGFLVLEIGLTTSSNHKERMTYFHRIMYIYTIATVFISIYMLVYELPLTEGWGRLGRITYAEEGQMTYSYHLVITITYLLYLLFLSKYKMTNKFMDIIMLLILCASGINTSIRKVIIAPIIFLLIGYLLKSKLNFAKIIKYMIFFVSITSIICYIIITNESLYFIIGRRLQALVMNILYGETLVGNYTEYSIIERSLLRVNAWNLFKQYPVFGYGLDAFKSYTYMNGTSFVYAHNNYLELLASTGIIGFSLYYFSILSLCKRLLNLYWKSNERCLIYPIAFIITQLVLDYGQVSYFVISYITIFFVSSIYLRGGS